MRYVLARCWPHGISCPTCGGEAKFLAKQRVWQCKKPRRRRQFSLKVGTIMEDSPIGLDKWLTAMWMLANCKNGISSYEVARDLGISQKSAWHLMHRIRLAAQDSSFAKMSGHVEVDETFVGGKARNMHLSERKRRITGTGGKDKTIVFGALETWREGSGCGGSRSQEERTSDTSEGAC